MTIHFATLIKPRHAVFFFDDTIMQTQTAEEMYSEKKYHLLLRKAGLKAQPEKTKFFFAQNTILGTCSRRRRITTSKEKS